MITTLREAKAKLSSLVGRAAGGEDVIITVRGKPTARLSAIPQSPPETPGQWADELRDLQKKTAGKKASADSTKILDDLRGERI